MGQIEEIIRLLGVEEVRRGLESVEQAQHDVGQSAEDVGHKGKSAFGSIDGTVAGLTKSVHSLVAGFATVQTIIGAWEHLRDVLKEIEEIRARMAAETTSAVEATAALHAQLQASAARSGKTHTEADTLKIAYELSKAGGLSEADAATYAIGGDLYIPGGLLEGENLKSAKQIAGFAGAVNMSGQGAADMLRFLSETGQLGTTESTQLALSQIQAAAAKSSAVDLGQFLSQLLAGGMGMARSGVPFAEIVESGVQAVNAEPNAALAAETMKQLARAASDTSGKFYGAIQSQARVRGMDPKALSDADRFALAREIFAEVDTQQEADRIRSMLPSEQAARLLKAYGGASLAGLAESEAAMAAATPEGFSETVDQYRDSFRYRGRAAVAERRYAGATTGMDHFEWAQMREAAQAYVERAKASGQISPAEAFFYETELFEDRYILNQIYNRYSQLQDEGVLSPEESARMGQLYRGVGIRPGYGLSDSALREALDYLGDLERKHPPRDVNVHYYNTVYMDRQPGDPDPPVSRNR